MDENFIYFLLDWMKHFLSLHGSDKGLSFSEEEVFYATCTPQQPALPTEVAYEVQGVRASTHATFYRGQAFPDHHMGYDCWRHDAMGLEMSQVFQ